MEKNKIAKYLKYAFSEIVLVVIGILIALSVNNWNENQKDEKVEVAILMEIKSALKTDLKDLEANINSYKRSLKSHDYIIQWLQSDRGFEDSLKISVSRSWTSPIVVTNQSAYDNLKQQGLKNIKNDSLRKQISHLYEFEYKKYINYNNDLSDVVRDINTDYSRHFNGTGWLQDTFLIKNIDDLKNDFSFSYHQRLAKINELLLINLATRVFLVEINKTIEMIDAELNRRL